MPLNLAEARKHLASFDFTPLFIEGLGWNHHKATLDITVDGNTYPLSAVAEKCGMAAFVCGPESNGRLPDYPTRRKIERQVTKVAHEHLIIFTGGTPRSQIWQWVRREHGMPAVCREHPYHPGQPGESLIQKLHALVVSLEEEETLTLPDVTGRAKTAFDIERVTKRFYDRFKDEHGAFLKFLDGIPDKGLERWYVSVMLNRLMFVYFIQKKGFLNGDRDYLKNKLAQCRKEMGRDRYYREFLCPLFFEGFAKKGEERAGKAASLLGEVPYLNGGIFLPHQIEKLHGKTIAIPDRAFEQLYEFFDAYQWHLDERLLKKDDEINPDVLGYIFEKYINQKQMGAYYTKEDITEYISKNTVIPSLFDTAREKCTVAFEGERSVWRLLREDPDRYIYPTVCHGLQSPLPPEIAEGLDTRKPGLIERRKGWNRPGPAEYALPTEIWREVVARRKRCEEVREKLASGGIRSINELITLNLDIRQFAQDVIENAEGPELLMAFRRAIESVTVLDPTCGSGAFLFAALNILDPLYEACLERMRFFLEEWGEKGRKNHPNYHKSFTGILKRVEGHPNCRYFILKSIIVNNLYGVDIMEEAVEICKLRLFLKLVAQIEQVEDLEPLPDIDFNIRAGNTLVGFANLAEIRDAAENELKRNAHGGRQGLLLLGDKEDRLRKIEEEAEIADRAFHKFHEMQTARGMSPKDFSTAKEELRARLKKLTDELDRFLAMEYDVNMAKKDAFEKWRRSHQPFHWFAEFYGILKKGGFDVIIGNPPWKEISTLKGEYGIRNYKVEKSGNLYAVCSERSFELLAPGGSFSFIVQLPIVGSSRMLLLREYLMRHSAHLTLMPCDDRPGKLFDGLQHCRNCIFIASKPHRPNYNMLYTTRYNRWPTEARGYLFPTVQYTRFDEELMQGVFPKLSGEIHASISHRFLSRPKRTLDRVISTTPTEHFIFYQEATQYWVKATVGLPYYSKNGKVAPPAHGRFLYFSTKPMAQVIHAILNSSLFYTYFIAYGDCFHLSDTLARSFPVPPAAFDDLELQGLASALSRDLEKHAKRTKITTKDNDTIIYAEFNVSDSKSIIDKIDKVLAKHYGITEEELDFIINYDIKYRMGQDYKEE